MGREEFLEKYGNEKVSFDFYYKYTFHYTAILDDGSRLLVGFGGDSDDIYRHEVKKDDFDTVNHLEPYMGSVYKDGKEVCSFHE